MAKLFLRVPSLKDEILPSPFRLTPKTIESWARPKSTPEEYWNSGKGNPIDRVEKLFDEAHPYDPEMVREIAEHFPRYADELDRRAGLSDADDEDHPCLTALKKVANANHRLVMSGLGNCEDPQQIEEFLQRTQALKTYVIQLEGCLRGLLKTDAEEKISPPAENG